MRNFKKAHHGQGESIQVQNLRGDARGFISKREGLKTLFVRSRLTNTEMEVVRASDEVLKKHLISFDEAEQYAYKNEESAPLVGHFYGYKDTIYQDL